MRLGLIGFVILLAAVYLAGAKWPMLAQKVGLV